MKPISDKFWPFTFYFLFFAGAAAIYNYFALYFKSQGMSGSQIGVLMASSSLIGLFSGPLLSSLADGTRRHRLILMIALIGNAAAVFLFPFAGAFVPFLTLMMIQSFFGGPLNSMVDNATMTMLGEQRGMYGRIRLGGTLGWGLSAPLLGLVVARFGMRYNFAIYSACILLALVAVSQMRFGQHSSGEKGPSLWTGLRTLAGDRGWLVFLATVFIGGCGNAVITNYLYVYLKAIGTTDFWMGMAIAISTVAEVGTMFFGGWLLARVGSRGLLTLGLAATAVRCMLYGVIGVPWLALTVQLLQFATFPFLFIAGVSYAHENAPSGMGATAQSIFSSAFMGFGFAAGGFAGGVLMDVAGVQPMYSIFGVSILLAAAVFALAQRRRTAVSQPA
jgi:MFS family permease